ncbi:MAG: sortase [Ilumatobacteraceae bacterium]
MSAELSSTRGRARSLTARLAAVAIAASTVVAAAAVPAASAVTRATVVPASVQAAAVPGGASQYVPLTPQRIARTSWNGTEAPWGFTTVNSTTIRVKVTDRAGVPATTKTAVISILASSAVGAGTVTVYPSLTPRPVTTNVTIDKSGRRVINLAHVRLGSDGSFELYRSKAFPIIIDLVGVYTSVTDTVSEGRFVLRPGGATRALDTRAAAGTATNLQGIPRLAAGTTATVNLAPFDVPSGAIAAVVNITAVTAAAGRWAAWSDGTSMPGTSVLVTDAPNQTRAGQAIVALFGGTQSIKVYSAAGGHLIVDLIGWYTGSGGARSSDGLFIPRYTPVRRLDTTKLVSLAPWNGSTYEFTVPNPYSCTGCVGSAVYNVSASLPWSNGYVTVYPAGQSRPGISTLNLNQWRQAISNAAIGGVSVRGGAIYTLAGAHMQVDVTGIFLGTPMSAPNAKPANLSLKPNVAARVYSYDASVNVAIRTGTNLDYVADLGYAAGWTDRTNVAQRGNIMLFAHRTKGTGPFRYLDQFSVNEKFILRGSDGHKYVYLVVDRRVVRPDYSTINAIATPYGPATAQLVACSRADGTPTSLYYRIVVTGRLIKVV